MGKREITLRCMTRNIKINISHRAFVTLSPNIPAVLRVYADKKQQRLVAMFAGITSMHDATVVPLVAEATPEQKEQRAEIRQASWRRPASIGRW